jgi:hypothetical protein
LCTQEIIGLLIVIVVASDCGFTQDAYTPAAPRILIELPDNIPSDAVWIRYLLSGPGNSGSAIAILKPEPSLRQYVINATFGDKPAAYAKIVVYARGCQFNTYTIEFDDASDVSKHFECDPLPGKIVHGFLPPAQIPYGFPRRRNLKSRGNLNLTGYVISCLNSDEIQTSSEWARAWVRVFRWAALATSILGGAFDITTPDFTRDPLFKGPGDASGWAISV